MRPLNRPQSKPLIFNLTRNSIGIEIAILIGPSRFMTSLSRHSSAIIPMESVTADLTMWTRAGLSTQQGAFRRDSFSEEFLEYCSTAAREKFHRDVALACVKSSGPPNFSPAASLAPREG